VIVLYFTISEQENMTHKIITIAAAALAIGALSVAPRVAEAANVSVSATVSTTGAITAATNAITTAWTGASAAAVPFTVTVTTNDSAGYDFTFTGTNAASAAFFLLGTKTANHVVYTVTGTATGDTGAYTNGTSGSASYSGPTAPTGDVSTFNVNLPISLNVAADTYVDTLVATITTL
jgi:hypothetical protein